jgi:hypothetical protein
VTQSVLETQLASRQTTLTTLTNDVSTAVTANDLTARHASILGARLGTDVVVIDALAMKVPTDTTCDQLISDNQMMYGIRVYEVMQPQVLLTIRADTETATETSLRAQFPTLTAEVAKLTGKVHTTAARLLRLLELEVYLATQQSTGVAGTVIYTTPADFPSNEGIFVLAGLHLSAGHIDLAAAQYALTALEKLLA